MADVKVSALTALTGADLANGDQFLVTDVGSPNVSKSITANELAQGSQFSSRYVAKADPIICSSLIGSRNSATSAIGAPTIDTGGSTGCINLPNSASGSESAYFGHVIIPAGWSTATVDFLCQAVDASAGDFRVIGQVATTAATGAGGNAATSVYTKTVTPAADVGGFPVVFTISDAATVAVTPGNYLSPRLRREVQDAADTNTNTLRVIAAVLRKAS